jgi:hypothetical protein
MAPAGGLAFGGAGRDGVGDGTDGPGEATGLPWIRELHPLINAALISRPASSRPLTLAVFALSQNISETSLRTK